MGDRGHVHVEMETDVGVWLYSHWGGSTLPKTVADALERGRARWGDPPYLARIIFSEMIKEEVMGETGYGISARPTDMGDGGRVVHVDLSRSTVILEHWGGGKVSSHETMGFQEFVDRKPGWGNG
jgi:hypothetical protein